MLNNHHDSYISMCEQDLPNVTLQGEMGHKSLESQNELWVPNDAAWNHLPNNYYRISLS